MVKIHVFGVAWPESCDECAHYEPYIEVVRERRLPLQVLDFVERPPSLADRLQEVPLRSSVRDLDYPMVVTWVTPPEEVGVELEVVEQAVFDDVVPPHITNCPGTLVFEYFHVAFCIKVKDAAKKVLQALPSAFSNAEKLSVWARLDEASEIKKVLSNICCTENTCNSCNFGDPLCQKAFLTAVSRGCVDVVEALLESPGSDKTKYNLIAAEAIRKASAVPTEVMSCLARNFPVDFVAWMSAEQREKNHLEQQLKQAQEEKKKQDMKSKKIILNLQEEMAAREEVHRENWSILAPGEDNLKDLKKATRLRAKVVRVQQSRDTLSKSIQGGKRGKKGRGKGKGFGRLYEREAKMVRNESRECENCWERIMERVTATRRPPAESTDDTNHIIDNNYHYYHANDKGTSNGKGNGKGNGNGKGGRGNTSGWPTKKNNNKTRNNNNGSTRKDYDSSSSSSTSTKNYYNGYGSSSSSSSSSNAGNNNDWTYDTKSSSSSSWQYHKY